MDGPVIAALRRHRPLEAALALRSELRGNTPARRYWLRVRWWAWGVAVIPPAYLGLAQLAFAQGLFAQHFALIRYAWIPGLLWSLLPFCFMRWVLRGFAKDTAELRMAGVSGSQLAEAIALPVAAIHFVFVLIGATLGFATSFPSLTGRSWAGINLYPADAFVGLLGFALVGLAVAPVMGFLCATVSVHLYFARSRAVGWTVLAFGILRITEELISRVSLTIAKLLLSNPHPLSGGFIADESVGAWGFSRSILVMGLLEVLGTYFLARWWILRRWDRLGRLMEDAES